MGRRVVYICGPISHGDLCDNINQATAAFVELAKAGFAPFCPHWSVYSKPCEWVNFPTRKVMCRASVEGNPGMTHAEWLDIDLVFVERSDAVLRLPGASKGGDLEVAHAERCGVPVFYDVASLVAWSNEGAGCAVS